MAEMSELKAFVARKIDDVTCDPVPCVEVYLKSEADKVIAELEESHKMEVEQLFIEIAELQKQVHDYAQGLYVIQARADKEARHQKYKRCLDKAERWLFAFYVTNKCNDKFYLRSLKYRELAEKFKEAKK